MDKDRRDNLRTVIGKVRRLVETDLVTQLIHFGLRDNGNFIPLSTLPHLNQKEKEIRKKLELALQKEFIAVQEEKGAYNRYIKHSSFTFINRIAALRAMEVRGLIQETVRQRSEYGGLSIRAREISEKNPNLSPDEILIESLKTGFRDISREIKVLFDEDSEYSLVFPSAKTIRDLFRQFIENVAEDDWNQDDVIGWVYQYYNEEAREEFKKSRRPLAADDVPVVNQFYTPHWVVRVLTDNTLGRLWLEQQGRCSSLIGSDGSWQVNELRRGIPDWKGDENAFREWVTYPRGKNVDTFCSYFVPLANEPPIRDKKPVREIKILDPACGSGHFLIYAFDVLYRMYQEDEPNTPVEQIPNLILEHNLFGIDIDLRAVQLAALSLFLKAKSYNQKIRITKMNLVCADSHITNGENRQKFLDRFKDDTALQDIFNKLFDDLNNTNEIGSLLKVREPFELFFTHREKKGLQTQLVLDNAEGQAVPTQTGESISQKKPGSKSQPSTVIAPKQVTVEDMLYELHIFEKECLERQDMGSMLFATETEKSVGLLSVLSQKYDVVLMNPPYGSMPEKTKQFVSDIYPRTKTDYYAVFIEMSLSVLKSSEYIGMLTPRSHFFLKFLHSVRDDILINEASSPLNFDLGMGILDSATTRTCATIIQKTSVKKYDKYFSLFCDLTRIKGQENKKEMFIKTLRNYFDIINRETWFLRNIESFLKIPDMPYVYWAPESLINLFVNHHLLDESKLKITNKVIISYCKQGLSTADDDRFTRKFFEVDYQNSKNKLIWIPITGGQLNDSYYSNIDRVIYWKNNGFELEHFNRAVVRNKKCYFKEGLTWPMIAGSSSLNMQFLSKKCIFSHSSHAIILKNFIESDNYSLLGILNSRLFEYLLLLIDPLIHNRTNGYIAKLPISSKWKSEIIAANALEIYSLKKEYDCFNETSTIFILPEIIQVKNPFNKNNRPSTGHPISEEFQWSSFPSLNKIRSIVGNPNMPLKSLILLCEERNQLMISRIDDLQKEIDIEVFNMYEISKDDKILIERELLTRRENLIESEDDENTIENPIVKRKDIEIANKEKNETTRYVTSLISFYIKQSIEEDPDGIVPLDGIFEKPLINRVREKIAQDFGQERSITLEEEIVEILGISIEEWIASEYFNYHVDLYKRRPIFWQITSGRLGRGKATEGIFSCFVHYHKLTRDTIPKILAHYLKPIEDRTKRNKDRISEELEQMKKDGNTKKINQKTKELDVLDRQLEELDSFKIALNTLQNRREDKSSLPKNPTWVQEKIKEIRDNGWNPVIDYGVRVNIEPLKELKLLPASSDRVK